MNGARSTLMRKGYLFTALAAAVLLAASSGTAYAQVTATPDYGEGGVKVEVPETVAEGNSATITISASASVPVDASESDRTVTVRVELPTAGGGDDTREAEDAQFNPGGSDTSVMLVFDANPTPTAGTGEARTSTVSKTISLQTTQDPDAEDENVVLNVTASGGLTPSIEGKSIEIDDDETQTYTLTLAEGAEPMEGAPFTVNLTAVPTHVDDSLDAALHLDASIGYGWQSPSGTTRANGFEVTVGNDDGTLANTQAITITTPPNDGNRDTDSITLTAYSGTTGRSAEVVSESFDVADINLLPKVTAMVVDDMGKALDPQPTSVAEGDSIMVQVTVVNEEGDPAPAAEDLSVELMTTGSADALDYRLLGSLDIDMDAMMSEAVELEVATDEDVGMEMLAFNAAVSGDSDNGSGTETSSGVLSLAIEDATDTKIVPKATDADYQGIKDAIDAGAGEDGLNPGETVTLMTSDLFDVDDGYNASYGVSVDGDSVSASASGEMITINAESAGESKITVTGTASMGSSSLIPSQSVSNVASLTFPVMVNLTTLTVGVAAESAEIMEGGSTMITATASRYVDASDGDVTIDLEVVGDATLDANSITIEAGAMSGSAMLTAAEDDDYADGSVTVVASGTGIVGNMQVAIAVTDNDEAPVDPEPENTIEPKSEGDAYPVITGAIEAGAGEEGLNPGESFSVMASDLFTVDEGYTASYAVSVDGDAASASASGDSVSVTADMAGEAKVTITGTSRMASSSFAPEQVATNVADITFLVTVVDKPLAALVVMLEMPANVMMGNIVEGESYDIVVSANRAVTEDTDVMIMRDRAGSDAGEDDYSVSMATIMTGYDSATAELMVTEDDLPDSGTNDNMGESLVLYGEVNGEQTNSLTFTIWDQAVPTLPLIGQLLLALFQPGQAFPDVLRRSLDGWLMYQVRDSLAVAHEAALGEVVSFLNSEGSSMGGWLGGEVSRRTLEQQLRVRSTVDRSRAFWDGRKPPRCPHRRLGEDRGRGIFGLRRRDWRPSAVEREIR